MIKLGNETKENLVSSIKQIAGQCLTIEIDSIKGQEEQYLSVIENQISTITQLQQLYLIVKKNCILNIDGYSKIANTLKNLG